jgi:hypothetical protein
MFEPRLGHSQVHRSLKTQVFVNGHGNHKLHMPISTCEDPEEQNGSASRIFGIYFSFCTEVHEICTVWLILILLSFFQPTPHTHTHTHTHTPYLGNCSKSDTDTHTHTIYNLI